jgi:hypothetical protein
MTQLSWGTFNRQHKGCHLVVVEVPADVSNEPVALIDLLINSVQPKDDFAVSSERMADGTRLFCAFAEPADADTMVEATNAQEENAYSGWTSEYHCRLDRAVAEAIRGADGYSRLDCASR